jgi:dienelactone hydrolase
VPGRLFWKARLSASTGTGNRTFAKRAALQQAGVKYRVKLYPAEHAFMRDEGPLYDPESSDLAFADMVHLFRSTFGESSGVVA